MPRYDEDDDGDWDVEDSDAGDDDWDDDATDEDDEPAAVRCPYCRREIDEESQRCPYCENYLSEEDAPYERKPWWIIIGVLLCFYIIYRWIVW